MALDLRICNERAMMSERTAVPLPEIEKVLEQLWEEQKTLNRIRASLFNLVVYVQDPARIPCIKEIVQHVLRYFPCRLIFIQTDATLTEIQASVATETIGQANAGIACDQIRLTVPPSHLQRIPFLILSYLIPDLPIYLLWGEDPFTEAFLFPYLAEAASRLIFTHAPVRNILELLNKYPNLELMDLEWLWCSGWRALFHQVFDNSPYLRQLQNARNLRIHYNSAKLLPEEAIRQPLYLVAWLANRLKWEGATYESDPSQQVMEFTYGIHEVTIALISEPLPLYHPGTVFEIELESVEEYHFEFKPMQAQSKVVVYISNPDTCDLPFTLPLQSLGSDFPYIKEIFYSSITPQYKSMLETLLTFETSA